MAKVKAGYPIQQKAYTDVRRTVVLADPQIGYRKNQRTNELVPFHDRDALDVAFQITRQFQPDTIVINGDWLDMSEWSDKFTREPEFFFTTQPALFETHFWLQKLRRTNPNARIVYIEGNHEVRLRNSIVNHLASLASFVSVSLESIGSLSTLLGLESLGIEYLGGYPNNFLDLGPIVVTHGHLVRGKSGDTVNSILQKIDKSHLVGHIHRPEFAVKTVSLSGSDKEIFAMASGCLCRIDNVVPGHARGSVWQQGIVMLEHTQDSITPYQVPIRNGTAIFGGNKYSSAFDVSELNAAGYGSSGGALACIWPMRRHARFIAKTVLDFGVWAIFR